SNSNVRFGVFPPETATRATPWVATAACVVSRKCSAAARLSASAPSYTRYSTSVFLGILFLSSQLLPAPSIARHQFIGLFRPPGAAVIIWKILRLRRGPGFQHRSVERPCSLHAVAVRKQRGVAQHRVQQQPLITIGRGGPKCSSVIKVHIHRANSHVRTWDLRTKTQGNSFIRLNAHGDEVRLNLRTGAAVAAISKKQHGRLLELNGDLRRPLLQPLARAQVKRHARPPPVLDFELDGREGFGVRTRIDAILLAISLHLLAVYRSRTILAANRARAIDRLDCPPHFDLFVAHRIRLKGNRRLHANK